ncbi:MAG: FAD-dependent oxidoreductase, partial [Actinobacteria bacterium]|nr:FAD-dependent oxidoreductase [Actinomycetota bacterium]
QLVALFGQQARTPLALHVKDWRTERWTSPTHVEQLGAYDTYSDPRYRNAIHERIWLASTETGPDHAGHIEGALAAAEVVVSAICGLLGTQQ